ncbi:MAG: RcnB family protein [Alphaproteobacteria bacterium]|nr:RcnB family protein [Alphaproteobacteria bacterium]MBV9694303.1 RcnB family protein [Alphaproteobacteria bacterium]
MKKLLLSAAAVFALSVPAAYAQDQGTTGDQDRQHTQKADKADRDTNAQAGQKAPEVQRTPGEQRTAQASGGMQGGDQDRDRANGGDKDHPTTAPADRDDRTMGGDKDDHTTTRDKDERTTTHDKDDRTTNRDHDDRMGADRDNRMGADRDNRMGADRDNRMGADRDDRTGGDRDRDTRVVHKTVDRDVILKFRGNVTAPRHFHFRAYVHPQGWYAHRWTFGERLPRAWFVRNYWITDYAAFGLIAPWPGFAWVQVGDDAVLVDLDTGEIVRVVYGIFY